MVAALTVCGTFLAVHAVVPLSPGQSSLVTGKADVAQRIDQCPFVYPSCPHCHKRLALESLAPCPNDSAPAVSASHQPALVAHCARCSFRADTLADIPFQYMVKASVLVDNRTYKVVLFGAQVDQLLGCSATQYAHQYVSMATHNLPWYRDIPVCYLQTRLEGQPWRVRLQVPDQAAGAGSYSKGFSIKAYLVRPCWPLANATPLHQALEASPYRKSIRTRPPIDQLPHPTPHMSPPKHGVQPVATKHHQTALTQDPPMDSWPWSTASLTPMVSSDRCQVQWSSCQALRAQEIDNVVRGYLGNLLGAAPPQTACSNPNAAPAQPPSAQSAILHTQLETLSLASGTATVPTPISQVRDDQTSSQRNPNHARRPCPPNPATSHSHHSRSIGSAPLSSCGPHSNPNVQGPLQPHVHQTPIKPTLGSSTAQPTPFLQPSPAPVLFSNQYHTPKAAAPGNFPKFAMASTPSVVPQRPCQLRAKVEGRLRPPSSTTQQTHGWSSTRGPRLLWPAGQP